MLSNTTYVGIVVLIGLVALTGLILGSVAIAKETANTVTPTFTAGQLSPGDGAPVDTYFNVTQNGKVWKVSAYFKYKGSSVTATNSQQILDAMTPPPSSLLTSLASATVVDTTTHGAIVFRVNSLGAIVMYNPTAGATIATNDLISANFTFTTN